MVGQYRNVPCVLIASKIGEYVSVNYDNYNGISDAMKYMIHELGMTKLGMVGGPDGNTDALEKIRCPLMRIALWREISRDFRRRLLTH